jgi:predicted phosphate transport protein (TIGR00153 family)
MFKPFQRSSDELFKHLSALGANLETAALRFDAMVSNWEKREELFFAVRETEHEGDRLLRELHDYLKDTFFVPGDREGIYMLTNELDDIEDKTLKIASYVLMYKVDKPRETFTEMVGLLRACCQNLKEAMDLLHNRANRGRIEELCLQVIHLEDEADKVYRRGLEEIFNDPKDLIDLLKWKDILDMTDDAVDHANHVAYQLMALNNNLH